MKITKSYLKQLIREALEEFDEDDVAELPLKPENSPLKPEDIPVGGGPNYEENYYLYIEDIVNDPRISDTDRNFFVKREKRFHEDRRGKTRFSQRRVHNMKVNVLRFFEEKLEARIKRNRRRAGDGDGNEPYYPRLDGVSYEE